MARQTEPRPNEDIRLEHASLTLTGEDADLKRCTKVAVEIEAINGEVASDHGA